MGKKRRALWDEGTRLRDEGAWLRDEGAWLRDVNTRLRWDVCSKQARASEVMECADELWEWNNLEELWERSAAAPEGRL